MPSDGVASGGSGGICYGSPGDVFRGAGRFVRGLSGAALGRAAQGDGDRRVSVQPVHAMVLTVQH